MRLSVRILLKQAVTLATVFDGSRAELRASILAMLSLLQDPPLTAEEIADLRAALLLLDLADEAVPSGLIR